MTSAEAVELVRKQHRIRCGRCGRPVRPFLVDGSGNTFVIRVRCACRPGVNYGVPATAAQIEDAAPLFAWPESMRPILARLDRHGRYDAGVGVISARGPRARRRDRVDRRPRLLLHAATPAGDDDCTKENT